MAITGINNSSCTSYYASNYKKALYVRSYSNSDYRHPARVGCDTYEKAFKIMCIKNNKIYSKPR